MAIPIRRNFAIVAGTVLFLSLLIAFAGPYVARSMFRENWAIVDLEAIDRSIRAYTAEHHSMPPSLTVLAGRLPSPLVCRENTCEYRRFSQREPYRFRYTLLSPDTTHPRYTLSAQHIGGHGYTSYYLDETAVLRYTRDDRAATSSDPVVPDWVAHPYIPEK